MTNEQRIAAMQRLLQQHLQPTQLTIIDDSHKHIGHTGHGGAGHFTVEIASAQFNGLPRVACHKLIYQAVDELMGPEIHALSIKLITTA